VASLAFITKRAIKRDHVESTIGFLLISTSRRAERDVFELDTWSMASCFRMLATTVEEIMAVGITLVALRCDNIIYRVRKKFKAESRGFARP
jgi:hypothetical protein